MCCYTCGTPMRGYSKDEVIGSALRGNEMICTGVKIRGNLAWLGNAELMGK